MGSGEVGGLVRGVTRGGGVAVRNGASRQQTEEHSASHGGLPDPVLSVSRMCVCVCNVCVNQVYRDHGGLSSVGFSYSSSFF